MIQEKRKPEVTEVQRPRRMKQTPPSSGKLGSLTRNRPTLNLKVHELLVT